MAHIVLFQSALGLRPGVHDIAGQLRRSCHNVTTPDLNDGGVFDDYESGGKKWFAIGIPAIMQQAQYICAELTGNLVFAGLSNGVALAEPFVERSPACALSPRHPILL